MSRPGRGQRLDRRVELWPLDVSFEQQATVAVILPKQREPRVKHKVEATGRIGEGKSAVQCQMEIPVILVSRRSELADRADRMAARRELGHDTAGFRLAHDNRPAGPPQRTDAVEGQAAQGNTRSGPAMRSWTAGRRFSEQPEHLERHSTNRPKNLDFKRSHRPCCGGRQ